MRSSTGFFAVAADEAADAAAVDAAGAVDSAASGADAAASAVNAAGAAANAAAGILIACMLVLCHTANAQATTEAIRLNQIGFYPDGPKTAVVVDPPTPVFHVLTADGADTLYTGTLTSPRSYTPASETVRRAEFDDFTETGEFVLAVPDLGTSHPFEIRQHIHQEIVRATIKGYYFQRASTSLHPAHADKWARSAGHPDDEVIVHESAASPGRPAGTIISAPKGWYDAGDYNKYIVNSGISTGTLLMLYEHYPEYFAALDINLPESGNGVPDLLGEILWNVRWMLAMQDPADGGVYHKLTTPNFEGAVMPSRANQPRYVVQKGTAAALDFAAVMALGARIYDDFEAELPGLADSMLTAAAAAWNWAQMNPEQRYNQNAMNADFNPDINTGEYGDGSFFDEFRWAAAELFITTKEDSFMVMYPPFNQGALDAPGWPNVGPMAFISLAHHRHDVASVIDTAEVSDRLTTVANQYFNLKRESAYDMVMGRSGDFYWGSNSLAANQSMMLLQAYRLTGDDRYLEAAISNLDYLLGRNATGYSFLTGYGDKTPMHPHHRQSESDTIREPVPGLLAGGPNPGRQDGCTYPSTLPAKSYVDDWCSYASNEITINWNAPLAYIAGAIEAIMSPTGLPVSIEAPDAPKPTGAITPRISTFPNPAVDQAGVRFELASPSAVTIRAYDLLGREVARLADAERFAAGLHMRSLMVGALPSGLYVIRMETTQGGSTHPFVVAR